jgi:hypothetical protein
MNRETITEYQKFKIRVALKLAQKAKTPKGHTPYDGSFVPNLGYIRHLASLSK